MKKVLLTFTLLTLFIGIGIYFSRQQLYNITQDGLGATAAASTDLSTEPSQHTSSAKESHPADGILEKSSEQKAAAINPDLKTVDRFVNATVLKTRTTVPDNTGCYERRRLVRADSKYPLILLEERLQADSQTGTDQLLQQTAMVADHVVVKVSPDVNENQLNQAVSTYGGRIRKKMYSPDLYLVEFQNPDLDSVSQAIQNFNKASGSIAYTEPDYIVSTVETTPNDTSFNLLWGMHNIGQTIDGQSGVVDADIDAPAAWDISVGSTNIIVAVIDTGIDYNHSDLAANMWRNPGEIPGNGTDDDKNGFIDDVYGWDFVNDDSNPIDDHYHGTHCAGTIGGVGNNGIGVAGVNWTVRLMALKFLSSSGSGYTSDAVDATHYATVMKAKLTSNSWGGGGYSQGLFDAIEEANRSNILFVAAAGNNGTDTDSSPNYPSSYANENIIAVAATDNRDQLAYFSSYGQHSVDLGAPGVDVYSCQPSGLYQYLSGTSMATPHVAGACALVWSINPSAAAATIKQAVLDGAEQTAALSGRCITGGRLNVYNALQKFEQNVTITPATEVSFNGFSGGPFNPPSSGYTINNIGTNSFFWTAAKTATWLDLSLTNGTLLPGQSNAVTASINTTNASALAIGTYTDTLTFSNTASVGTQTRKVNLTVRGEITFNPEAYTVGEADGTMLISVRRAGNTNRLVTVDFATSNGTATAGSDYVATNGTLVFSVGDTVKSFTIPILNDSAPSEGTESVVLTISNPTGGGTLGEPNTASLMILDDDVDTHYVSLIGGNIAPYTNWAMAATSIQPAVNAAISGDVVRVAAGRYVLASRISVPAGITVQGAGAGATIVDGNNTVGCFILTNAVVAEMTITKGNSSFGGGVYSGTISNCTLSGNQAGTAGGGACVSKLYNCMVTSNSATSQGGGAYFSTLYNCVLNGNSAGEWPCGSGAAGGTLYNCTLSDNYIGGTDSSALYNSIIYPDSLKQSTNYNCWTNNPKFVGNGDYSLRPDSPCIGAANPLTATTSDIRGFARDQLPDIGAFEYRNDYFMLTITGGSGSGLYSNGTTVAIAADDPSGGKAFDRWIGDTQYVNNVTYTNALVTIPAQAVNLTATYTNLPDWHTLTVNGGSGGGLYSNGTLVAIAAAAPAVGKIFDRWIGDTQYVANVSASNTTVTMPAQEISLTATYVDAYYALTVNGGSGSGSYTNQQRIVISANGPSTGKVFDRWTGATQYVASIISSNTTVTMPAQAISITATYKDIILVDTHYVSLTGGNIAPYTNWATAATSIQPAVNAATSGDVVRVAAGRYVLSSRISVPAGITVQGAGAGVTIVDGNNAVGCFILTNAVVAEMTITKGNSSFGGGVYSGIISNCTLSGNRAGTAGGGACASKLYNCMVTSNSATSQGGGVYYSTLYNCVLNGNSAGAYPVGSGAAGGTLYNCTLSGNYIGGTDSSALYNSIIYPDSLKQSTNYNCWTNNPKFVGGGDYSLRPDSPCIGAANPLTATACDIQGFTRDQLPDIGAFEYRDIYYTMTINNGTGGGSYTNGTRVEISADVPASGKVFDRWIGDTQYVNNVTYTNALVTIPAQAISLTATYKDITYTLTVNSGTGDGSYTNGQQVTITAETPASGKVFDQWAGDTQYVAGVTSGTTTVTMPAQAITLTATYKDAAYYTLTVISEYGGSEPSGTNSYNTPVSVVITNSPVTDGETQYVCSGWLRTGSEPSSGVTTNTGIFVMTNDTTVVWLWTTNYWLETAAVGNGTVDIPASWQTAGYSIQISAVPNAYYHFTGWSGDVEGDIKSSPLTLVMNNPRWVAANFAPNITANTETPEWWLAQYGLTNFNADVLADIDLDGVKTWEEYIAGTDPTNRNSVLLVDCNVLPNGRRTLSWFGVQGRIYALEHLVSLYTNNWEAASFESPGANTVISITDAQLAPKYFYRVRVRIAE